LVVFFRSANIVEIFKFQNPNNKKSKFVACLQELLKK
jgi:hypothetical protein